MVYIFIFLISFVIVFLITPDIRYVAMKFYAIDRKGRGKTHNHAIPRLGGVAIYLGFWVGLMLVPAIQPEFIRTHYSQIIGLFISSTIVWFLGIYDDFYNAAPITKIVIEIVVAALLINVGFKLDNIVLPGLPVLNLGFFSVPITILWIVGITNAVNFIDGLDGLASGIIIIASLFLFIGGIIFKSYLVAFVAVALFGANLAFLKYNFYPAKIFMGDTGSLFLGFILGAVGLYKNAGNESPNLFFAPVAIILLLPIIDTLFAVIRRIVKGKNLFLDDFSNIHYYYLNLGFSQLNTVKRFYVMTLCLGIVALLVFFSYFPLIAHGF